MPSHEAPRRSLSPRVVLLAVALVTGLTACPGRTKRRLGPDIPLPTDGDKLALRRFEETRARFLRDGGPEDPSAATGAFEDIARDYPDDPIVPHARLYAGMAAVEAGEHQRAIENLEEVVREDELDPALRRRGQLFYGIALGHEGRHEEALRSLAAARDALDGDSGDERAAYWAAWAEASQATGRADDAVVGYDAWHGVGRASERAYALARLETLVGQLDEAAVVRAYQALASRDGPGAALVGARLAAQLDARGERDRAGAVREEIQAARERLGLKTQGGSGDKGDPDRLGAVLSLSGKRNRLGDFSMRGLALAAGPFERDGGGGRLGFPRPFQLSVHDDGSQPAAAATGVDALARQGVIAIVGPDDSRSVERAAGRAAEIGVPLVSLHPAADLLQGTSSPFVFHAVHSAEQRARALARHALAAGVRDFAIFAPDSGYGRQVGAAFRSVVERGGGQIVVEERYPPASKSFQDAVKKLKKPYQALFIPDRARALELIAPALAAANLNSRPLGQKARHGRAIWLLGTADLLDPSFLRAAGRYTAGAVLAPGFFADRTDPRIGEFVARYERSFGRPPTALDAYAFDAAWVVRSAVEKGAGNRRELADQLASGAVDGLTGKVSFDSSHRRRDDGVFYEVVEVRPDQFELRARR